MLTLQAKWAAQTVWETDEPDHAPTKTLQPTCDSACRLELSKVTLFLQDLSPSFIPFDDEFSFGGYSLVEILGAGTDGSFFGFWDSAIHGSIFGATVFLPTPSDRAAFDSATSEPDRYLEQLFKALGVRDATLTAPPSYQQTGTGSSMGVSGTCMFRGYQDPSSFDVALFREGYLGVTIFYVYPIGATPAPDIDSTASLLHQRIGTALGTDAVATLQPYFIETATPPSAPIVGGDTVADSKCNISFTIPDGWEAIILEEAPRGGSHCAWGIRPYGWEEIAAQSEFLIGQYAFSIAVYPLPLDEAAPYGFFELVGGQWYVTGRQGSKAPASAVTARDLTILRGVGIVGAYDRHASYVGLGEAPRAAASDGLHTAIIVADLVEVEPALEVVLRTLRFNS